MSYPEPRYHGENGEVSGVLRRDHEPPDLTYPNGTRVDYLATGKSTSQQFGLYRWNMGPHAGGPGPHFHRTMSESFFVLGGTVTLYDGQGWVGAGEGDFFFVPEGGLHGFRNDSDQPASMLILFAPGAPREEYFEGLGDIARADPKPSQAQLDEFYLRHDNHWV